MKNFILDLDNGGASKRILVKAKDANEAYKLGELRAKKEGYTLNQVYEGTNE